MARSEPQLDKGSGIGQALGLPSIVRLVTGHSVLGSLVPLARRLTGEVLLADKGCLDIARAVILYGLLPTRAAGFRPLKGLVAF